MGIKYAGHNTRVQENSPVLIDLFECDVPASRDVSFRFALACDRASLTQVAGASADLVAVNRVDGTSLMGRERCDMSAEVGQDRNFVKFNIVDFPHGPARRPGACPSAFRGLRNALCAYSEGQVTRRKKGLASTPLPHRHDASSLARMCRL